MSGRLRGAGVALAAERYPGSPPALLLIHATGFCKETWGPVIRSLRGSGARSEIVAIDQRGHGESGPATRPIDWWDLGEDAAAVAAHMASPLVGAGHSSGAAALAMAEISHPGTFDRLVLIEPIVFPPPFGHSDSFHMVETARRRRRTFAGRDEAYANFHGRGPFVAWTEAALDAYIDGGFAVGPDGTLRLRCDPDTEAGFYASATAHGAWDELPAIACPVTIVGGETSDSHPRAFLEMQADRFRDAEIVVIPDAGHLVPMERPGEIAAVISGALGAV